MKLRPLIHEFLSILIQAIGLAPVQPARVRVRSTDRLDATAYSERGIDMLG